MRAAAVLSLAGLAACAASATLKQPTANPMAGLVECVVEQGKQRGYKVTNSDPSEGYVELGRLHTERPQNFQDTRLNDRLTFEVKGKEGTQSELRVTPLLVREFATPAGPRREEVAATDSARADARAILAACAR